MGDCHTKPKHQEFQFKHKQIFKPKNHTNNQQQITSNKQNIPPPRLDTFSIATPNDELDINKDLQFHRLQNKESALTYHLSNSLVQVNIQALNQKQPMSKLNLPILVSKDTDHSSNNKDSDRHNISVDSIIKKFQSDDLLDPDPRRSIQIFGPNKQSDSYIQKQQIGMKYTKSYYVDDDQNQINRA